MSETEDVDKSREDCDNPRCAYSYDITAGVDHWFSITEYDIDEMAQWGYCSRKCMIEHQKEVLDS